MSKARTLADFISDGSEFADGTISVAEVSGAAPLASPTFTGTTTVSGDFNVFNNTGTSSSYDFKSDHYAQLKLTSDVDASAGGPYEIMFTANGTNGKMELRTNNVEYLGIDQAGKVVINEGGANADFRVESDGNSNMVFVDASKNQVGIGTGSWDSNLTDAMLVVNNGIHADYHAEIALSYHEGTHGSYFKGMSGTQLANGLARGLHIFNYDNDSPYGIQFWPQAKPGDTSPERAGYIGSGKQLIWEGSAVFNETSADEDFRVESDTETHMLFVDASLNRVGIGTNGPASTLSVDGDILSNWGNQGEQKIGIAARSANVFSTTGRTLILTGADAVAGPQAMAGGDVIVRGGKGRANTGLNTYAGHLYLEGGEHTTSGETGGAGNVYIKTAGNTRASFYAGGDIALSTNNFSQFFKLDHSTNEIMIGQTLSNDAELLTVGSAGQATYSSSVNEGMLGLVRFNNTGNPNQHSGLFFRVTSNNGSNNSMASIGLKQPSSGSHNSQVYFNVRSQSQNAIRQYALIDSENGFIMNDGGESYMDFRVESDTNANALFVDAGNSRVGINNSGPSFQLQVGATNTANMGVGWMRMETFAVDIPSSGTRWYKIANYQAGSVMLQGQLFMSAARNGGANQTNGARIQHGSLAGYNNGVNTGDWGDLGTNYGHTAYYVEVGTDDHVYLRVNGTIYGGTVYCMFQGRANWAFDGSYVTSAP